MRLATLALEGREALCLDLGEGFLPIRRINETLGADWPEELPGLLASGRHRDLANWLGEGGREALGRSEANWIPREGAKRAPVLRHPPKIWGIGLNYAAHAADLSEAVPTAYPASFMKPDTAVIGPGEEIRIPPESASTTAEAELGVVIGRRCRDLSPEDWLEAVAGFVPVIDVTAEDILRQNPRYLTLSKSFDTFLSIGSQLISPDEIGDPADLSVATVKNGEVQAENRVARMTFSPAFLVAFHSRVMTLLPGDLICTGTPGATPIADGDRVACRIKGFDPLENPVRDRKLWPSR